jgi:hypothetical protein
MTHLRLYFDSRKRSSGSPSTKEPIFNLPHAQSQKPTLGESLQAAVQRRFHGSGRDLGDVIEVEVGEVGGGGGRGGAVKLAEKAAAT